MKTVRSFLVTSLVVIFCTALVCAEGTYYPGTNKGTPRRIVSLGPAATEILFALDADPQLVGRTDFCNYPSEAQSITSIGGFDGKTFSIESVIAKRPDFVYLYSGMHDHLVEPLKKYGIAVYVSDVHTVNDVISEIDDIGSITGHQKKAADVIALIKNAISSFSSPKNKKVYWELWNSPFMSIGRDSFINDVISSSGGTNIFQDLTEAYPVVSEESIIARNPDVILIPSDTGISVADVLSRKSWSTVNAIKNKKVFLIDGDISSRSSWRIAEAISLIAQYLSD